MHPIATRLGPRRAPAVALLLVPPVRLVLCVGLTAEPTRLIFAGDLSAYRRCGLDLLAGSIPYRDFTVEYPPLALPPMTPPLLPPQLGGIDDLAYI